MTMAPAIIHFGQSAVCRFALHLHLHLPGDSTSSTELVVARISSTCCRSTTSGARW